MLIRLLQKYIFFPNKKEAEINANPQDFSFFFCVFNYMARIQHASVTT